MVNRYKRVLERLRGLIPNGDKGDPASVEKLAEQVFLPAPRGNPLMRLYKTAFTEQRVIFWLFIVNVAVWVNAFIIFAGVYTLQSRPVQMGISENTLREDVESSIEEIRIQRDHYDLFVITVLKLLYNVDDSGAAYRSLLKGSINPEILTRFDRETNESLPQIRAGMMVQNLTVNTIKDFVYNEDTDVASAYVMGYIANIIQQSERGTIAGTIPFRARVFIKHGTRSNLSPLGFYLEEMEERIGQDALNWDLENI